MAKANSSRRDSSAVSNLDRGNARASSVSRQIQPVSVRAEPSARRRRRPLYWSVSQALVWICTRDQTAVSAVHEPFDAQSFGREFLRHRRLVIRPLDSEQKVIRISTVRKGLAIDSSIFADQLPKALAGGRIAIWGRKSPSSKFKEIEPQELGDLELRIEVEQGGAKTVSLWSKQDQIRRWEQLRFSPRDIRRLWPSTGFHLRKSWPLDQAILTFLYEITANGPIKKDDAMSRSKTEVAEWTRNSFERAWKYLPEDRKFGRGKHGTRAH